MSTFIFCCLPCRLLYLLSSTASQPQKSIHQLQNVFDFVARSSNENFIDDNIYISSHWRMLSSFKNSWFSMKNSSRQRIQFQRILCLIKQLTFKANEKIYWQPWIASCIPQKKTYEKKANLMSHLSRARLKLLSDCARSRQYGIIN